MVGLKFWNPNVSNAFAAKLFRVSEAERNGMWLLCFYHILLLAQKTNGFVVRPILMRKSASSAWEEHPSNMQRVEKLMADQLHVPVYDLQYYPEDSHTKLLERAQRFVKDVLPKNHKID